MVHDIKHAPQHCRHSEKQCYMDGINLLDPKYDSDDSNSDSDLENLNEDGSKIRLNSRSQIENHSQIPSNVINYLDDDLLDEENDLELERQFINSCRAMYKETPKSKQQSMYKKDDPESVRILGVHFDPNLTFKDHLRIVAAKCRKNYTCCIKWHIVNIIIYQHFQFLNCMNL